VTTTNRIVGLLAVGLLGLAGCGKASDDVGPTPKTGDGSGGTGGTTPQPGGEEIIKIVSSLPHTGSAGAQTNTIVNGVRMAIEERGGKVGRFKIVYEPWDDASAKAGNWDAEVEAKNANKAIADRDVMVYIGTFNSGAAKISMPELNKVSLAMVSPANTATGLTKPNMGEADEPQKYRPSGKINYWRVVPADDIQGELAAQWMKSMGAKTVYILDDREVYGKGIADIVAVTAEEIGIKVVGREGIDSKAQEYKSLMTKIKALNPDFIYFGGTTQTNAGQLAKDLVGAGLNARFMVPDGCFEEAFITAAGAENLNDRVFITFGGLPPAKLTGKGAEFVQRYRERFKSEPEAYAIYGYVCGQVALDAIEKAGKKDREAIRAAMAQVSQTDGVLGTWRFDDNGDTSLKIMSGNTVRDGKYEFLTLLGQQ
jgi:branched-chain amino acid transport system substrate-binding protein